MIREVLGDAAYPATGLSDDKPPGGEVPGVQAALVVAVKGPVGDVAQVEGRTAEPPNVANGADQSHGWASRDG